jgi:hypothetical protein
LIRDYFTGDGPFAEDPPEELAQRRIEGAYVAKVHQRVKQYIKQVSKELRFKYQWPRRHSFNARINDLLLLGLLVKTGEAAPEKVEPQQRGAGQLGSAGGFSKKLWVRLAPGADTRPEWADLMGYIDRYYMEKALAEGRPPPNIRPQRRELATALQPVGQVAEPVLRRPRRRAQVSEVTPEVLEVVRQFEERRVVLRRAAAALSISGVNATNFETVGRATGEFYTQVLRVYGTTPFPDLPEALEFLQNCVRNLQAETEMTQRRVQAVNFCRESARRVAEAISRPLEPPEAGPEAPEQAPRAAAPPRRVRRTRAAASTPAPAAEPVAPPVETLTGLTVVEEAHARLKDMRPNVKSGERALDKLETQGVEVGEAREKLEEYQAITRDDYEGGREGAEEYRNAREEAWTDFLDTLESTEPPEEE